MSNFQIHELNSVAVNRNSNIIHDTEVSTDEWDTGKDTAGAVADLASANVAAPYDATVTYAIGQYCLYEGNIYRCIAITTGAFDSTAWTQIVVSGEFRRVVELTSAQYAQLTPAEQNNGTIYVKTDEETTADDIPYSAGVSVADKLDNLTTPVISSVTWNDTNVTGDPTRKSVITLGKLVVFSIEFTPLNGKIAHNNIIATGLPIPNNGVGSASARFVYSDKGRQFAVDDSGNLLWYFPGGTTDYSRIDITGVYIK